MMKYFTSLMILLILGFQISHIHAKYEQESLKLRPVDYMMTILLEQFHSSIQKETESYATSNRIKILDESYHLKVVKQTPYIKDRYGNQQTCSPLKLLINGGDIMFLCQNNNNIYPLAGIQCDSSSGVPSNGEIDKLSFLSSYDVTPRDGVFKMGDLTIQTDKLYRKFKVGYHIGGTLFFIAYNQSNDVFGEAIYAASMKYENDKMGNSLIASQRVYLNYNNFKDLIIDQYTGNVFVQTDRIILQLVKNPYAKAIEDLGKLQFSFPKIYTNDVEAHLQVVDSSHNSTIVPVYSATTTT